jgi:hypothetical protein
MRQKWFGAEACAAACVKRLLGVASRAARRRRLLRGERGAAASEAHAC